MEKNYDEMNDEVTTISEEEFDDTVEEFEDDVVEESKVKAFARKVKKYGPTVLKVSGMAALTLFGYALGAKSGHKDDTEDDVVAESEYKEVDTESVESDSTTSEEN